MNGGIYTKSGKARVLSLGNVGLGKLGFLIKKNIGIKVNLCGEQAEPKGKIIYRL